jgi:hypothetical protein
MRRFIIRQAPMARKERVGKKRGGKRKHAQTEMFG